MRFMLWLLLLTAEMAVAGEHTPVVVELFTSEGCSSCPAADRLLQTLDRTQPFQNAELIVLSEHVDYWNESWKDPFSSAAFTERQRIYGEQFGLDSVYTPQVVIDGSAEGVGSNEPLLRSSIQRALLVSKVGISLSEVGVSGHQIHLHAHSDAVPGNKGRVNLYIALAAGEVRSEVKRGENANRALTHVAVVKTLVSAASLSPGSILNGDFNVPLPQTLDPHGLRVVAFLQVDKSHAIIGATRTSLP